MNDTSTLSRFGVLSSKQAKSELSCPAYNSIFACGAKEHAFHAAFNLAVTSPVTKMLQNSQKLPELAQYIESYFGILEAEEIKKVVSLFNLKTTKKGEYLLKAGNHCEELSFVQSGLLRIFAPKDDKDITQWISTKGEFSTDLPGFIFESPSRWTIQALVDSELYTITRKDYKKIETLVPKWAELEKLFITRCFGNVEDRIFSFLSMSAEERYNAFFESHKQLFNQVPLQFIASMLGMTPETLSRIRKKQVL